jgi:hypothetical protein
MNFKSWMLAGAALVVLISLPQVHAQQNTPANPDKSGMKGMDMGDSSAPPQAAGMADSEMSDMHMEMSAHMRMTEARPANPGDEARAEKIVAELRPAIEKYRDYHVALDDGFQIFMPNIPQPHYHFTSFKNAVEAQFRFDPERPTSLLYKKTGDGYQLEGAMYTAPRRYSESQLDARIPLSVAHWHQHVNFCLPPKGTPIGAGNMGEFGLRGSITTESACDSANGRWFPVVFGWMVHVYPYETDPAKIWAH